MEGATVGQAGGRVTSDPSKDVASICVQGNETYISEGPPVAVWHQDSERAQELQALSRDGVKPLDSNSVLQVEAVGFAWRLGCGSAGSGNQEGVQGLWPEPPEAFSFNGGLWEISFGGFCDPFSFLFSVLPPVCCFCLFSLGRRWRSHSTSFRDLF